MEESMDERLQKALEFSNYTLTLTNQKKNIRNRVAQLQTVHFQGGMFHADHETIAFVKAMLDLGNTSGIMIDTRENPVKILSYQDLMDKLIAAYHSASNELAAEFEKINKARNIKKIMDW